MRGVGRKEIVAHWRVDDFNTDYPSFNWGHALELDLQYEILTVTGIAITVIEAAPIAVAVAPSLYTHYGDARGINLDWKDNAAGKSDLFWGSLGIPVDMSHEEGQTAGFVSVSGYAVTDDLELTLVGVAVPNEQSYQQKQSRYGQYGQSAPRSQEGHQTGANPPPK